MNNNVDRIITGDCLPILREMDSNSVDSIVTDPPYGLHFMGKKWDYDVPSVAVWEEALRVLKPGGHILCACGTRTQHRMAVNIEDAGFEIRDLIAWIYGSGFPKSLDVGKAIDKINGAEREVIGHTTVAGVYKQSFQVQQGKRKDNGNNGYAGEHNGAPITSPSSPEAIQWQGWGSAIKPAMELWTLARKPLEGTIAGNVLAWGTGGLNIDGCRIGTDTITTQGGDKFQGNGIYGKYATCQEAKHEGRFPANVIHDGSDEATSGFPNTTGSKPIHREEGFKRFNGQDYAGGKEYTTPEYDSTGYLDSGSASRYFYCAKSSKSERNMGLGLDCTCTIKYIIDTQTEGVQRCKDVNMVLVQLLQRATSDMEAMKWHIGESGESIMGLCLLDSLSTTLTEISKITELKILDLLTHSLIRDCIAGVNCETGNGGSPVESAGYLSKSLQTITPEQIQELARGVRLAVLPMLSIIKDVENWKPLHNIHSTVKPIALMRYLCRLITPPNGIVLDPYAGSGSTCVAAVLGGFHYIGCEREEEYVAIAERRIKSAVEQIGMGI